MEPNVKNIDDIAFCPSGCPSREVLDIIADKWTVLIIQRIAKGPMRHNELARSLGEISQKVLTQGLRKLERNGIVSRTVYPVVPPKVEYALTTLGTSLVDVLSTLSVWSNNNFPEVISARKKFDNE
jgi:DNA-binding HxlR family transcriptional regulator